MNTCLVINRESDRLKNENATAVLNSKSKFAIKICDKIQYILVCNHLLDQRLYGQFNLINGQILTITKYNKYFSVMSIYSVPFDYQVAVYELQINTLKNKGSSEMEMHSLKTKEIQYGELLREILLSKLRLDKEVIHPRACLDLPPSSILAVPKVRYPHSSLGPEALPYQLGSAPEGAYLRRRRYSNPDSEPPPGPLEPVPEPKDMERMDSVQSQSTLVSLYQSTGNLPVAMRSASILPQFQSILDMEDEEFDPYEHRSIPHPTTDFETLIHLMKGSLGTGILAMPVAFKHAGLFFGLFSTVFIGVTCAYSVHILVKCAHKLCKKVRVPSLGFDDIAEVAFFVGPTRAKKYAKLARFSVNFFLMLDLLGCCCIYVVFVAKNAKQVIDYNMGHSVDLRFLMLAMLPFLIAMNLIPHLKYLAPFSMVANTLMTVGMLITFYYIFQDLPSVTSRPNFQPIYKLPVFFGTAIFALEGIGVVMPLENNMKNPGHFISRCGVLNIGMGFVVTFYASVGFFGFLRYGEATEPSITLNLPDSIPAQSVKIMMAVAIFLTYALQFHVPLEIIWKGIKHKFGNHLRLGESILRIFLVTLTVLVAILVPHLGPCISLCGAVCLSYLGLMFPATVEIIMCSGPGESLGCCYWVLWKNLAIILFGIVGLFTGSYTSILEMISEAEHGDE